MKIKTISRNALAVFILFILAIMPIKSSAATISPEHVFTVINTDYNTETKICPQHKNCYIYKTIKKDMLFCTSCNYICYQLTTLREFHQLSE
ncbi:MAG TPA: hypothetical protein DHW61_12750 [Lachnoclostridium phytofermentans]|uniref:Uncharacterized protein n=1 Tax=Lachnoclostridium phytofermentans TaxID=66219 RepID=A0A3D2X9Q7_9FIRM|nr:hypothetical protein [Lachnoclostridium sp.]HCL03255.1 hypothetical protein [Lachnoclostridium phytofermentans]